MRIDAYNQVSQIYQANKKSSVSKTDTSYGTDKIEISQFGKDYQVAKQAVANVLDIREDKVADVKNQMDTDTYNVSAEDLVAKLSEKYGTLLF